LVNRRILDINYPLLLQEEKKVVMSNFRIERKSLDAAHQQAQTISPGVSKSRRNARAHRTPWEGTFEFIQRSRNG